MESDATGSQPVPITPSYYAIIPAEIRYNTDLDLGARFMYGEITALANSTGRCTAKNEYFAKLYDVHINTISRWVAQLVDIKAIHIEMIYRPGTRYVIGREMSLTDQARFKLVPSTNIDGGTAPGTTIDSGASTTIDSGRMTTTGSGGNNTSLNNNSPLSEDFVNQEFGERVEEIIFWIRDRKSLRHMPPQGWLNLMAELQMNGIGPDEFKDYYIWLEGQPWRTGAINEKMMRNQLENYLKRNEVKKHDGKQQQRSGKIHPGELLKRLREQNAGDSR